MRSSIPGFTLRLKHGDLSWVVLLLTDWLERDFSEDEIRTALNEYGGAKLLTWMVSLWLL